MQSKTADTLTNLQSQYGYAAQYPDKDIRSKLFGPVFGSSDGQVSPKNVSIFHTSRMPLFAAAAGFAENAQPTAFAMHRERIRSAVVPLRRFLEDVEGASLFQTEVRTAYLFSLAEAILKDPGISTVFGVNETIPPNWPLQSSGSEGAKLIEKITAQLPDISEGSIPRDKFVRMQRVAEKGYQSIGGILDTVIETNDDALDQLTVQLYAWGSELGLIGGARPQ
ncbi:hypothetical protein J7E70_31830 [Variovorax paradoxus]|nr:hypothetical protein [Variovorax paradoxus]